MFRFLGNCSENGNHALIVKEKHNKHTPRSNCGIRAITKPSSKPYLMAVSIPAHQKTQIIFNKLSIYEGKGKGGQEVQGKHQQG
jgi:hypothetical protein